MNTPTLPYRYHLALFALALGAAAVSMWRGLYTYDPFHWGLMLSDAVRWCEGEVPYRELWVPYGFLTTAAQGIAYCAAGQSLVSVLAVTVLAWSVGVYLTGRLATVLTGHRLGGVAASGLLVLLHPAVEYPWANYLAFPWLAGGALLLTSERFDRSRRVQFAAGLSLGLAILARDALWPAVIATIVGITLLHHLRPATTRHDARRAGATMLLGAAMPMALLLGVLWVTGLLPYWYAVSVRLTQLYVTYVFPDVRGTLPFLPLLEWIGAGVRALDPRVALLAWVDPRRVLMALTMLACIAAVPVYLVKGTPTTRRAAEVGILSLLLASASFHIPELFRLATGTLVGTGVLVLAARRWRALAVGLVAIAGAMWVTLPVLQGGGPVPLFPSTRSIAQSTPVQSPAMLAGMRWSVDRPAYYTAIESALHELQRATPCSALRLYNHSFDGVVAALSPFPLLHPSPVGPGGGQPFSVASFRTIRPERELAVALAADAPLVVTHVAGQLALPATFERWRAFPMPPAPWFSDGSGRMQLMVTRRCLPPA